MDRTTPASQPTTLLRLNTEAKHYKWLVATIVLVAGATQTFAGTSINLVIPRMMAAFDTDLATTQWVVTGWLLARTLVMPLLGWIGGIIGNRNMFVGIMAGFVLTTTGCGLSTSIGMLIAFRVLQGLILGSMEGLTAVILVGVFPPHQRGLALGLRSVGWSAGQIVFYTVGGYLIEQISWRLVFFLGIPSAIAALVGGLLVLPQQRDYQKTPVDHPGLLALAVFLVPLLLAISFGRDSNTQVSTLLWLGIVALIGGVFFILRELWAAFPAVNLRLFKIPTFRLVCSTAFLNNVGLFGALFMVPIFLQQVIALSPLQAGLVIVPALVVSGISGVVTGRLSDLLPPPLVIITMMLSLSIIFYSFSSVTALTAVAVIVMYVILYRVCMTGVMPALAVLTVQSVDQEQVRMGQGLLGLTRSIGASLGVAVTSVFYERRRIWHQLQAYDAYDTTTPTHHEALDTIKQHLHQAGIRGASADQAAMSTLRRQMDIEAVAAAFRDSFVLISVFFLIAVLPTLYLLIRYRRRPS
ncbi:MAG: DHA2 family efflux MFS transporter permease subunit [bacterium]|nr:DHA2 family efflux MFS transporter permease subunit [bacterium]